MKLRSSPNSDHQRTLWEGGAFRQPFALILLVGLGGLLTVFLVLRSFSQKETNSLGSGKEEAAAAGGGVSAEGRGATQIRTIETVATRPRLTLDPSAALPDPTEQARQLIEKLRLLNPGVVTAEAISESQEVLLTIENLNVAAIPALEEFFFRGDNVRFDSGQGTNLLGAPTLRIALLKLLSDFTAPENEEFEVRLLQFVSDPEEVTLLANQLEAAAPGKYLENIREAAEASLRLAGEGRFPGQDTTPVLRLLERFGEDDEPSP